MRPLYLDEDSQHHALVNALRHHGVDVLTSTDAGMNAKHDDEHLAFAKQDSRVLFTFNVRDFVALHTGILSRGESHAGIIVDTQLRYSVGERTKRIMRILRESMVQDLIFFLSDWPPLDES